MPSSLSPTNFQAPLFIIQFDKAGNMYFIDELNGGNIYRFTSAADFKRVLAGRADYFAAGQTFVLRVGDGNTPNATGAYTWIPFTDQRGRPLPGAVTVTDPNGVTSVDARNTTNLPQYKGTDYQRPEDMQIQTVRGADYLYVTTTSTHHTRARMDRFMGPHRSSAARLRDRVTVQFSVSGCGA